MKVYMAARYSRKDEIAKYARLFRSQGIEVSSTWFDEPHTPTVQLSDVSEVLLREYATRDLAEIDIANAFIFFSESDQTWNRRGGRHVEFGYALASGKRILVIGPIENIFHHVRGVEHVDSLEMAIWKLKE